MRYARFLLLVSVFTYSLPFSVLAQNSPYLSPKGNVGTWSWGKSQPKPTEEDDEAVKEERGSGETSWERMQSQRQPEETAPPQGELLKSFSPLNVWRWWRGEKKAEAAETPESENTDSEVTTESEEE